MAERIENIEHIGYVDCIEPHGYKVKIFAQEACGSCSGKHMCGMGSSKEKIIDVVRKPQDAYALGDKVKVVMEKSLGFKALFFGYIMPFIVMVTVLFIVAGISGSESMGGLASLISLAPYYLVLYLFKDKLKHTFAFSLRKIND